MSEEFAGRLREQVSMEEMSVGRWVPAATLWAAVRPVDGGAAPMIDGETIVHRPRWMVTIRALPGLSLRARLRWRGRWLRPLRLDADPVTPDRMTFLVEEVGR